MSAGDTILALVALVAAVCFAAICVASTLDEMPESPLRRWRKLRTPSCILCEHYAEIAGERCRTAACTCRRARERAERLEGRRVEWLRCLEVRGTRACVFEAKKTEEEEK